MARATVYEEPLMVKLDPALKRWLKIEAAARGTDMSKRPSAILAERTPAKLSVDREEGRAAALVEHMTGRAAGNDPRTRSWR